MAKCWFIFTALLPFTVAAQDTGPDNFRIELTGAAWNTAASGTLQAAGVPVALHSDLDLQDAWTFFGKLSVKPGRRHRINIEGSPYAFSGTNELSRSITFNGRTYSVQDTVSSETSLTYFFGSYQFDVVSRRRGHFGLQAGAAYLNASGTIRSTTTGIMATRDQTVGLPLAGAEFRVFLLPGSSLLNVNGEVKGMQFGGYGSYFQGAAKIGVGVRWLTFEAGYQYLNADIHENRQTNPAGLAPVIQGPVLSVQFRR